MPVKKFMFIYENWKLYVFFLNNNKKVFETENWTFRAK